MTKHNGRADLPFLTTPEGREKLASDIRVIVSNLFPQFQPGQVRDVARDSFETFKRSAGLAYWDYSDKPSLLRDYQEFMHDFKDGFAFAGAKTATIGMKIRRNYGAIEVEYEYAETVDFTNDAGRRVAYARCEVVLEKQHAAYSARLGVPMAGNGGGAPAADGSTTTAYQVITAERLGLDVKDGKKRFKVYGGEFQKWGVNIYPELLDQMGIDPASVPLEGSDVVKGWRCKVEMTPDGKPRKVIEVDK